ncbi:hypothetical protein BU25DRAFT_414690 [Macroventuria anomochaeta]|uniref:Uncharacterized protein n=1 Tax=Macroventuria anomochaeta TaxID=301207 RepID=A0ACB6RQJ6_9PLEO|nr:uncharacterized protein BU25DRAFT_414690 [Macroventuria anomochaeta]KAF2623184.1 hypothetical protein BU25DRAFT_414690 [Macroventuria anomochaeta]
MSTTSSAISTFFCPYDLCLLFTLPIVATGLIALQHNGISAIDGGFLRIPMTAATGQTVVETTAGKGCLGGYENIPVELRKLKVRFEELVTYETTTEDVKAPDTESAATSRDHHGTEANEPGEDITLMRLSQRRGTSDDQDQTASQAEVASGIEKHDMERALARRAGSGVFSET